MCDPDPDPDRDLSELLADIERIRRALDADPDSADLHARLAESLHELAFEPTWDDHRTPHLAGSGDRDPLLLAAMHLSRACGLRPGDVELRRQMADVLHDLHAYDLMSTELSRALRSGAIPSRDSTSRSTPSAAWVSGTAPGRRC